MTISSLLGNITNAISDINISGVTVKDKDEIAASWTSTSNVLYPHPDNFMTNFRPVYKSFTRGAAAQVDLAYTLNYRFLGTQIGDMATFTTAYSQMVDKVLAIIAKMIETTAPYSGRVDMELGAVTFGPRIDPAGNTFHGADFALNITEMQNT